MELPNGPFPANRVANADKRFNFERTILGVIVVSAIVVAIMFPVRHYGVSPIIIHMYLCLPLSVSLALIFSFFLLFFFFSKIPPRLAY